MISRWGNTRFDPVFPRHRSPRRPLRGSTGDAPWPARDPRAPTPLPTSHPASPVGISLRGRSRRSPSLSGSSWLVFLPRAARGHRLTSLHGDHARRPGSCTAAPGNAGPFAVGSPRPDSQATPRVSEPPMTRSAPRFCLRFRAGGPGAGRGRPGAPHRALVPARPPPGGSGAPGDRGHRPGAELTAASSRVQAGAV